MTAQDAIKYSKVTNIYGIAGESKHRTPDAALKTAAKREGEGWVVVDQDNRRWDFDGGLNPVAIGREKKPLTECR